MRVLITGGQGDIAQAIKKELNYDYDVFCPSRDELDVTNEAQVKEYMNKIKPDVLINNAGVIYNERIETLNCEHLKEQFLTNTVAPLICAKYAIQNGVWMIINIGSTAGSRAIDGFSAYCASKRALHMITECIMTEGTLAITISPCRTKGKLRKRIYPNEDSSLQLDPEHIAEVVYYYIKNPPPFTTALNIHMNKDGDTYL
jgi:NADP-dependent 3-hydroxy acid dehydrogenase YdfG